MQVIVEGLRTSYERIPASKDGAESADGAGAVTGQAASKVRVAGSKPREGNPAVLILHGWGDDSRGWAALASRLAERFDVLIPDLPGFGGSERPAAAWGLDQYADFVAAFLRKLDVQPYAIVGHSNGGAIAVRGLAGGVLRADKLVLLASAGIRSQLRGRKRALQVLTKAGKLATYPLPTRVKSRLRGRLYSTIGSDLLVAEHMQDTFKRIVTDDIQADASKLAVPALLVYGEDDAATPVQYGRILRNLIAGSRLEIVPEGGHFVHLDQPARVSALTDMFLA